MIHPKAGYVAQNNSMIYDRKLHLIWKQLLVMAIQMVQQTVK